MGNEELKIKITELIPTAVFEEGGEWLNITIESGDWLPFATKLRDEADLHFNYLFCLPLVWLPAECRRRRQWSKSECAA